MLPRVVALMPGQVVLSRSNRGFDVAWRLFRQADERCAWAAAGRTFDDLVKGNPRSKT
jgi:hypothetical protein